MTDTYIPIHVRNKLDARKYARMGLMSVAFGQEPGSYEHEISPEDRAVIDQVIRDNNSADALRRKAALEAWSDKLWNVAPALGPAMFAAGAASLILGFLGKKVLQPFTLTDNGGALGACDNGKWSSAATSMSVSQPYATGVGQQAVDITVTFAMTLRNWSCDQVFQDSQTGEYWMRYNMEGTCYAVRSTAGATATALSGEQCAPETWDAKVSGFDDNACTTPFNRQPRSNEAYGPLEHTQKFVTTYTHVEGGCFYLEHNCNNVTVNATARVCPGETHNAGLPGDLDAPSDLGNIPDPADVPLDAGQLTDLANQLRDTPWGTDYMGNPEDDPGNISLPPTVPGTEPVPGTPVGGMPLESFRLDDAIGKSPIGRLSLPSLDDPLGDRFKPGDPFSVDMGGTPFGGRIGRYKPGAPGGAPGGGFGSTPEFIGEFPPYGDERFAKNRCYKNKLATKIAKELAIELGVNPNIAITPGCDKRFTGCFKKGTPKFDAMWRMADLCGYGVFPDPTSPTIAPIEPLNVHHGPYHEMRDLFVFQPVFDSLDVPRFVSYYRPPAAGRPGSGFEATVEVITPYHLPEDKIERILAPRSMTKADAIDAAAKKAKAYQRRAKTVEFAVPLKLGIRTRHQTKLRRPLYGYDGNFMVWELRHDANEEGFVTVIRGVELSRTRYAPRFEDYATVGGVMS